MRTKEEIARILSKRKYSDMMSQSTWADLVTSIQVLTDEQKTTLVKLIASGSTKKAGEALKQALFINAKQRAVNSVDAMLLDDNLNLEELDSLL